MGNKVNKKNIGKVVYFDEESVTDYVQIVSGGTLEKTTELINESNKHLTGQAEAKVSFSTVFAALAGIKASASAGIDAGASFNADKIARNIVKNTILTDFLGIIGKDSKGIKEFTGYSITTPKDSLTYVALISPYLSMLKGGTSIPAGEFNLAVEKIDNTLKNAKGYYEFLGTKENDSVIFRFNINAFRNNYKATDLMKMNIVIYAIEVGKGKQSDFNFNSEFGVEDGVMVNNPAYPGEQSIEEKIDDKELIVYDVLLAGVEIK